MRTTRREHLRPMLTLGLVAAALPGLIVWVFGHTKVQLSSELHFYGVGLTALAAAIASAALTLIGARQQDERTVLIGTAFAVMAALLGLHGIATPGILFDASHYGAVMLTGGATLPAGAAILALSALPLPRGFRSVKALLIAQAILLSTVVGLGVLGLFVPSVIPTLPAANSNLALSLLAVSVLLFVIVMGRALRTFLLTRRAADLLVVVGLAWLTASVFGALTMTASELGWWLGHMLELDGILVVGIPVALDFARTTQSRPLTGDLTAESLVASEAFYLGSHVRAMTLRLAEKDDYTEQHTRRVALRAVQIGGRLGLSNTRQRELAIGALVHDIGKLSVPDSILQKPGPLDEAEYATIKRHPEHGAKLLDEIGGFSHQVRRLVFNHHERLDGTGYPRGLTAESIDLETRIISACDVYDALISNRVYRAAWSHERAIGLLIEETGTGFDGRVVEALAKVLEAEISGASERSTWALGELAVAPA